MSIIHHRRIYTVSMRRDILRVEEGGEEKVPPPQLSIEQTLVVAKVVTACLNTACVIVTTNDAGRDARSHMKQVGSPPKRLRRDVTTRLILSHFDEFASTLTHSLGVLRKQPLPFTLKLKPQLQSFHLRHEGRIIQLGFDSSSHSLMLPTVMYGVTRSFDLRPVDPDIGSPGSKNQISYSPIHGFTPFRKRKLEFGTEDENHKAAS
ncbi:hypothetical protein EGR_08319 [Echinococcus granulosus]|uniref:Uncharacterized protein n=1 Tax=Echinococcus granulosus TaxID=6210 RepID=W6U6L0_ECHGR|nr:hypothetical protein EGR_08319 [Echinococcus granulosus]EUB56850.1 hypothetical protein EGR_08319 [Echinococcus granulosus]